MKKALLVLLVVLVVLTGLPILMGMAGMASCPDCGPAVLAGATCAMAILAAGVALLFALFTQSLRSGTAVMRLQLHTFLLERPPRLA
ncbi:MAG TPA: hypothetical protein VMZ51_01575 [Acidimicrobiales bacterium]|nr:hypothetical protein [Acidimicrobiales bacterium]